MATRSYVLVELRPRPQDAALRHHHSPRWLPGRARPARTDDRRPSRAPLSRGPRWERHFEPRDDELQLVHDVLQVDSFVRVDHAARQLGRQDLPRDRRRHGRRHAGFLSALHPARRARAADPERPSRDAAPSRSHVNARERSRDPVPHVLLAERAHEPAAHGQPQSVGRDRAGQPEPGRRIDAERSMERVLVRDVEPVRPAWARSVRARSGADRSRCPGCRGRARPRPRSGRCARRPDRARPAPLASARPRPRRAPRGCGRVGWPRPGRSTARSRPRRARGRSGAGCRGRPWGRWRWPGLRRARPPRAPPR